MDGTSLNRRVWPVLLAAVLVLTGLVVAARPAPARAAVQPAAGQYVPLTPARIVTSENVPAAGVYSFRTRREITRSFP
jgi:hypothetical protein